jgi:hypothetical protein
MGLHRWKKFKKSLLQKLAKSFWNDKKPFQANFVNVTTVQQTFQTAESWIKYCLTSVADP